MWLNAVVAHQAGAMHVDPDELFEAAGYPSVRALRRAYKSYKAQVDPDLLQYLARLPRSRQRRLLLLLEAMEHLVEEAPQDEEVGEATPLPDRESK